MEMEQPLPVQEANEEPVQENLVVESVPQQMCGDRFVPTSVKTQVVAGTNYAFTVSVNLENEPKEELDVRVFKPLPHTQQPPLLSSVSSK